MSDLNGPKKETVRITLPPRVPPRGSGGAAGGTTRIPTPPPPPAAAAPKRVMPPPPPPRRVPPPPPSGVATPVTPPPPPAKPEPLAPVAPPLAAVPPPMPPRPRILPPPPRISSPSAAAAAAPSDYPGLETDSAPRKETARITILPQPPAAVAPTVKMAKTQPLLTVPPAKPVSTPVIVSSEGSDDAVEPARSWLEMLDAVPLPICWTIFGISTVTLLIQIWNYFSS